MYAIFNSLPICIFMSSTFLMASCIAAVRRRHALIVLPKPSHRVIDSMFLCSSDGRCDDMQRQLAFVVYYLSS